jgi:hypothetical protein
MSQVYNSFVQMGVAPLSERCIFCDDGTSEFCRPHTPPDGAYNRAVWHSLKSKKLLAPLRAELLKDIKTTAEGMDDCHQVASKPFARQLLTFLTDNPRGWWDTTCTLWAKRGEGYEDIVQTSAITDLLEAAGRYIPSADLVVTFQRGLASEEVAHYPCVMAAPKGAKKLRPCVQVDGEMVDLKDFIAW